MSSEPQRSEEAIGIRRLRRWYDACWVFLGLTPSAIALHDGGRTGWLSAVVLAVLGVSYGLLRLWPGDRPMRPLVFLWLLIPALGAMAALPGGGAALLIVSLPMFWIYADGPRRAVALSGVATAATVLGGVADQGWSPDFGTGNAIAALIGYATGSLLGLWLHHIATRNDARAERLGAELEAAQQKLAEAHRREGAAAERERLAREIHDTLAQGFASIVVLAEAARTSLESDPARGAQQLRSIEQTARENLAEARALVGSAPRTGASVDALRRTLERFTEDTGIPVTAELPEHGLELDQTTRIALLRCTQESLANVRKHAAATAVGVVLGVGPDAVELEITDDGRGFRVDGASGFGLDGMRRRLAELGGEFTVTSSSGDGTRVLAVLPAKGQE
ncbi:sensor histidine kinase [Streptomyces sp. NPDC088106]|uniref:sensor histidine kinase n=1 Tax=unclassified Streptomyces TaxID=2593676 RepID=UPI00342D6B98